MVHEKCSWVTRRRQGFTRNGQRYLALIDSGSAFGSARREYRTTQTVGRIGCLSKKLFGQEGRLMRCGVWDCSFELPSFALWVRCCKLFNFPFSFLPSTVPRSASMLVRKEPRMQPPSLSSPRFPSQWGRHVPWESDRLGRSRRPEGRTAQVQYPYRHNLPID